MAGAVLALIKVHVVEMQANFELLDLWDLPKNAAQRVLERSVSAGKNHGLEQQYRTVHQFIGLEELELLSFIENIEPQWELARSQWQRTMRAITSHTERRARCPQVQKRTAPMRHSKSNQAKNSASSRSSASRTCSECMTSTGGSVLRPQCRHCVVR